MILPPCHEAAWVGLPNFSFPEYNINAILFLIPVAIAPAIEHIGDMLAISSVTGKKYLEKPGLQNTLLGDGLATSAAALFGGPPNTTYSEVTGAVMLTKAFNPKIMDLGSHFCHCGGIYWQGWWIAGDHSDTGNGGNYDSAVWFYCCGGAEHSH